MDTCTTICGSSEAGSESILVWERENFTPAIILKLEHLRISLPDEISKVVALSEERLTFLQSLHLRVDEEASVAIQNLSEAMNCVNESRKTCHYELDLMLGEQIHTIQAHAATLETFNGLVSEYFQKLQSETQGKREAIEASDQLFDDVNSLLERVVDVEAKSVVDHLQIATIIKKKANCDYFVPVLGSSPKGTENCQALRNAVPFLNSAYAATSIETLCLDDSFNEFSTFVCDESSNSVRVFNTVTGELQRTIEAEVGLAYGLALLKTPVPLLFVSSCDQHKIFVYKAMSGEFMKTIGAQGAGEGQLNYPWGLCVRPAQDNQAALLYVCDSGNNRVQVFDTESGRSVMTIGTGAAGAGDYQFDCPEGAALFDCVFDPMLFVADFSNDRVQVFHVSTGSFVKTIGQGLGQLDGPMGVSVCAVNHVSEPLLIVSENNSNRIHIFNIATGVSVKCVGSQGSDLDQFNSPFGLQAFLISKNEIVVHVADYGNKRVQKINIDLG